MRRSSTPPAREPNQPGFNGFKVLWAAFIGAGVGTILSIFLDTFIRNTPADIPQTRLLYLYGVVIFSAVLFGSAIESMRQLQASAPDKEYRVHNNTLRGRRRR